MTEYVTMPVHAHRQRPIAARAAAGVTGVLCVVLALAAGIGWLYALRDVSALSVGPVLHDALPLQRLAGQGDQPLLRLIVAWLPTGLVAGLALGVLTRLGGAGRAAVAGTCALVVLFAAGAVSDTVTASDPLSPHVAPQLQRGALWVALVLVVAGAAVSVLLDRRSAP